MDVREKLVELFGRCAVEESVTIEPVAESRLVDFLVNHGVTVQEWISVNDRLPEEKVDCIVYYKHAYCDNDDYWAIGMCFYDGEKFQLGPAYKVTHWMPMPNPPKGEERKGGAD